MHSVCLDAVIIWRANASYFMKSTKMKNVTNRIWITWKIEPPYKHRKWSMEICNFPRWKLQNLMIISDGNFFIFVIFDCTFVERVSLVQKSMCIFHNVLHIWLLIQGYLLMWKKRQQFHLVSISWASSNEASRSDIKACWISYLRIFHQSQTNESP